MLTKINDINDISDAFEEAKDVATLLRMASQNKNDAIGEREHAALIFGATLLHDQVFDLAGAFDAIRVSPSADPVLPVIHECNRLQAIVDAMMADGADRDAEGDFSRACGRATDAFEKALNTRPTTTFGAAAYADFIHAECVEKRGDFREEHLGPAMDNLRRALASIARRGR